VIAVGARVVGPAMSDLHPRDRQPDGLHVSRVSPVSPVNRVSPVSPVSRVSPARDRA
jgi:hypothetical protein